jgi:hypothetical protein
LPGFLRQHYTTSSEMASVLSAYLVSNGAADTRYIGSQPKQARDAKQEPSGQPTQLDRYGRPIRRAPPQEASRPDADGRVPPAGLEGRQGRNRLANPDAAKPATEGQTPAAAAEERGPDGRRLSAKQRLSKRSKPGEELPKTDAAKTDAAKTDAPMGEAAKGEVSKDEKTNITKDEGNKPEVKPEDEKSESAKLDASKAEGNRSDVPLRADPVPAVTPAPKSSEGEAKPAEPASQPASTAASDAASEPQGGGPTPAAPPPASVAASTPPPPPVAPAGPPAPPISQ